MVSKFLDYVEIRTKITSIYAFFIAIAYLFMTKQSINIYLTSIFFISMFCFDMTTTAINNYIDSNNGSTKLGFNRTVSLNIIYIMFIISSITGLYLAFNSGIIVFLAGGLCFLCGIFYTYGPIPISRLPLGEVMSGIFYGIFIPFLVLYINTPRSTYIDFNLEVGSGILTILVSIINFAKLIILSIGPVAATACIMLANNTCDLEEDKKVDRFTLPYYIGIKNALRLYIGLYVSVYISAIIMVVVSMVSWYYLIPFVVVAPLVIKNIRKFYKEQIKSKTFICAVNNFILLMSAQVIGLILSGILNRGI